MYNIVKDLFSIRRDLMSDGFDEALEFIQKEIPLDIHKIPSGTECWTWIVPEKWSIKEAYIESNGKKLLDIKDHPLHVISYSLPINKIVTKEELFQHLHTNPKRPNAIPFEFKYYEKDWGFCIQHDKLKNFVDDKYKVVIESKFEKGDLKIGELVLKGHSEKTIVLVAHLCHPGMANDDLSGVAVLIKIAKKLMEKTDLKFTYRILFLPETIGSVAYLSQNEEIIPDLEYGIFLEMLGNENRHALQLSFQGNTLMDKAANNVMKNSLENYHVGKFRTVVSNDEMVFNGPGVNIPMISISRWPYEEYHTSDDNLSIIKPEKLEESKKIILNIIEVLEKNFVPKRKFKGPPFLSRYNLWVDWRENPKLNSLMEHLTMSFEGDESILDIAEKYDIEFNDTYNYVTKFIEKGLVTRID